jgi:hypothetical protein
MFCFVDFCICFLPKENERLWTMFSGKQTRALHRLTLLDLFTTVNQRHGCLFVCLLLSSYLSFLLAILPRSKQLSLSAVWFFFFFPPIVIYRCVSVTLEVIPRVRRCPFSIHFPKSIDNSNSQRRSSRRQGQSRNRFRNDTTTKEQSSNVVMTRRLIHRERGERESPGPARDTFKKSAGGNKVAGRSRLTAVKKHTAPLNTHMCAQHVELDRYTSRAWNNWNTNKRNIDKV